jgi:hypothetical protein
MRGLADEVVGVDRLRDDVEAVCLEHARQPDGAGEPGRACERSSSASSSSSAPESPVNLKGEAERASFPCRLPVEQAMRRPEIPITRTQDSVRIHVAARAFREICRSSTMPALSPGACCHSGRI